MSLTVEPDYQDYIVRLVDICRQSSLLFPRSIGGDNTKKDLITQVIANQLPIPNLSIEGPDAPYIFVAASETPTITQLQQGRNELNKQGGKLVTLEFYLVMLSSDIGRQEAEAQLYAITSALTTELGLNRRLTDPTSGLLPLAVGISFNVVPYIYDITQNETVAKNCKLRLTTGVNLR
jgi:hypothetical protein